MKMKHIINTTVSVAGLFLLMGQPTSGFAGDDATGSLRLDYWSFGTSGDATVKGSDAHVNDANKVFDGHQQGFVLGGEHQFESSWGLNLDLFMGRQSNSIQTSASESVDWDATYYALTFGGFYPFVDSEFEDGDKTLKIDGMFGLRSYVNTFKVVFNPYDPADDKSRTDYVNWVDPYIGLRLKSQLSSNWALELYGDAGGFGIGSASELSVLAHGGVVWTVKDGINIIGGYRLLDFKTANQSGDKKTQVDLRMTGPTIGIEGRF